MTAFHLDTNKHVNKVPPSTSLTTTTKHQRPWSSSTSSTHCLHRSLLLVQCALWFVFTDPRPSHLLTPSRLTKTCHAAHHCILNITTKAPNSESSFFTSFLHSLTPVKTSLSHQTLASYDNPGLLALLQQPLIFRSPLTSSSTRPLSALGTIVRRDTGLSESEPPMFRSHNCTVI